MRYTNSDNLYISGFESDVFHTNIASIYTPMVSRATSDSLCTSEGGGFNYDSIEQPLDAKLRSLLRYIATPLPFSHPIQLITFTISCSLDLTDVPEDGREERIRETAYQDAMTLSAHAKLPEEQEILEIVCLLLEADQGQAVSRLNCLLSQGNLSVDLKVRAFLVKWSIPNQGPSEEELRNCREEIKSDINLTVLLEEFLASRALLAYEWKKADDSLGYLSAKLTADLMEWKLVKIEQAECFYEQKKLMQCSAVLDELKFKQLPWAAREMREGLSWCLANMRE